MNWRRTWRAAAFAAAMVSSPAFAQTPVNEVNTAALTGPWNQADGNVTFLTAHGANAVSPTTLVPAVVVHWTFWSENCEHLANFNTCLTQDDSVVIDPSDMGAIGPDNTRLDSRFDLTGRRGMYTAHAFEADERCRDPGDAGFTLVPGAMNGTWSIADTTTNAAFGDRAQGLEVDPLTGSIAVPDAEFGALDLPFFNPASLQDSDLILWTVVEDFGDLPHEIGPPQGRVFIGGRARVCDTQEVCLSLPDVVVSCALFSSLRPGPNSLVPETLMPGSSGFLRLSSPRFVTSDPVLGEALGIAGQPPIVGRDVWIFSHHGQKLGPFGTGSSGTYTDQFVDEPTPTPEPSVTPTPGPTATLPLETPTPSPTNGVTPTPGPTPTNGTTPTPGGPTPTLTPAASPTPTNGLTPTPGASPTPTPMATQLPAPTPTPSPTPQATQLPAPTPTPVASQTPAPTPSLDPFGPG